MRFAYLIMAHNEFSILEKLLHLLDDERNDIYLHIDKKAKQVPMHIVSGNILQKSSLRQIQSHDVRWGAYSQVQTELELLFTALNSGMNYDYYHLISGVDLPLHNQNTIHDLFERNKGYEFVGRNDEWAISPSKRSRYQVYHPFQEYVGRGRTPLYYLNRLIVKLQVPFIHRQKERMSGGSAWFSISNDFAEYIYEQKDWIEKSFRFTLCGDEHMIHSLLIRSPFACRQYLPDAEAGKQNLRYFDFYSTGDLEGSPKTLNYEDAIGLVGNKDYAFARKFSTSTEERKKAVDYIYSSLTKD